MSIKIILNFITFLYFNKYTLCDWPIKKLNYQIDGKDYSSYLINQREIQKELSLLYMIRTV